MSQHGGEAISGGQTALFPVIQPCRRNVTYSGEV